MELEEEDWGDEEDEDEDEVDDEGGVVLMEGAEGEEEGAEYGSGVEEQSVSLLGLLERRDENRAREAPASGLASGGDAKSEDGGGEAGEAGGAGDVEDWARLSNGAVLVSLPGTHVLPTATQYLLLTA